MEKVYLTKKQSDKLKNESIEMQNELDQLAKDVSRFAAMGDLSENAEYQYAKERQRFLLSKLSTLREKLSKSSVVESSNETPKEVSIGTSVKVLNLTKNSEEIFNIVGSGDFDFDKNEIPSSGPIGGTLMGCVVDETVTINTPAGSSNYKILEISAYDD